MSIDHIRLHTIDMLRSHLAPMHLPDGVFSGLSGEIEVSVLDVLHNPKYPRDGRAEEFVTTLRREDDTPMWSLHYEVVATALGDGAVDATIRLLAASQPGRPRVPLPL